MFLRSVKVAALASIITLGLSVSSHAAEAGVSVETLKPSHTTASVSPVSLPAQNTDFMKTSLKDFKVKLIGPLNLSVSEDYSKRHFKHLDTNTSKPVMSPYENTIGSSTYYSGTIAKTGFKFKF